MEAIVVERAFVRVAGPDAESYLQGQLSQDLGERPIGASFLLEPTGKVCALLRYVREATDAFVLDTDAAAGEALVGRLRRFLLRTKAEIEVVERRCTRVFGGQEGDSSVPGGILVPWPAAGDVRVDVLDLDPPAGTTPLDALGYERRRILAGVPVVGVDIGPDTIPGEVGAWAIESAVSFTKGCYTGQELVARIDSRGGNVPRPLRVLQSADGSTLVAGHEVDGAGVLTSAAADVGLAPLARRVQPGDEVRVGAVLATVLAVTWVRAHERWLRALPFAVAAIALLVLVVRNADGPNLLDYEVPEGFTPAPPPTTAAPGAEQPDLVAVGGTTTTLVPPNVGRARLAGVVTGPDGAAVVGAVVRIERVIAGTTQVLDVVTGPDGRYDAPGIGGGRYRVRAFLAPTLAQAEGTVLYLRFDEDHPLDLALTAFAEPAIAIVVAPDPPLLGGPLNLAVRVSGRLVDVDGVVRTQPLVGGTVSVVANRGVGGHRRDLGFDRRQRGGAHVVRVRVDRARPGAGDGAAAVRAHGPDAARPADRDDGHDRAGGAGHDDRGLRGARLRRPGHLDDDDHDHDHDRRRDDVDVGGGGDDVDVGARTDDGRPRAVNPYEVLGVAVGADQESVRRAWLLLARRHHPDRGGDPVAMQAVNQAWTVLGDPARRRAWDREHGVVPEAERVAADGEPEPVAPVLEPDWFDARPLLPPKRTGVELAPILLFVGSVAVGCLALVFDEPAMLGFAAFVFFLSCVAVAVVAMLTMRRSVRAGRR